MPDAKMGRHGAAPDFGELRAAAEELVPVLRERAPRAEELRRLPDETIADLHRTGLFRILQPGRVGGSELPFRSIVELVAVIGRACGSTAWVLADVAAEDVFVPDYRTLAVAQITGGPNPGSPVNQSILYQLPAISLFAFCIAGVSLGIAKGAIEYFSETTRSRTSYYTGRNLADFVTLQVHLAEAAAITDSAQAVMLGDCDEAERIVADGDLPTLEQRARYRRDGAYAATLCTRAVDVLFQATGGGAIYARNPLQRAFRDVHAANAHYVLNWDINGAMYGRVALGLSPDASL